MSKEKKQRLKNNYQKNYREASKVKSLDLVINELIKKKLK